MTWQKDRPEDAAWVYETILNGFHDEYCEYDGEEDGVAVCAGDCRTFAEEVAGLDAAMTFSEAAEVAS